MCVRTTCKPSSSPLKRPDWLPFKPALTGTGAISLSQESVGYPDGVFANDRRIVEEPECASLSLPRALRALLWMKTGLTTQKCYLARAADAYKLSYKRGCQEKNSPPPLQGQVHVVACIQPHLRAGGVLVLAAFGSPRIPARATQLKLPTRRFHDAMVFDAFGSGSYASKSVG